MKRNKDRYFEIIAFIGIFIFIFSNILIKHLTNLDEIWNYNISRQIANGLIPYKDISMITTPFLSGAVAIFLKIIGDELIIFRIITALLATVILFLTYKIFNSLIKNKIVSFILTLVMCWIYYKDFTLDYNFGVLAINLIILLLEIKKQNNKARNEKVYDYIIGTLAGSAILTKQTVGLFVALEVILLKLIQIHKKEDIKLGLKGMLTRILGILTVALVFILYLLITNSLFDFIDYTILGIGTFSNSVPYIKLLDNSDILIQIASIAIPIFLVISLIISVILKIKNKHQEYVILTICSLAMTIITYPISDRSHFLIAVFISVAQLLYILCMRTNCFIQKNKMEAKEIHTYYSRKFHNIIFYIQRYKHSI